MEPNTESVPHQMTQLPSAQSSRSNNREHLLLDYNPSLSEMYKLHFYEAVSDIAYLSLDKQVERLNKAVGKAKLLREANLEKQRSGAYYGLTQNIAALLLLRDLLQIGWKVKLTGAQIQLYQEQEQDSVTAAKNRIRKSMNFERRESLLTPSVQQFVRSMERKRIFNEKPCDIFSLVADGKKLMRTLEQSIALDGIERSNALQNIIKPYLQLVEEDKTDKFTGFRLSDIWRYFRLSWATPYRPTPGRNIFYLVRDRAQPCHPIIGIAALGNCVIGLKCRDDAIGWTPAAQAERLHTAKQQSYEHFASGANEIAKLLFNHLEEGIEAIDIEGITSRNTLHHPTIEAIASIETLAQEAAEERYEYLREEARVITPSLALPDTEIQDIATIQREDRASSHALFRRKRAAKLAALLRAKLLFSQVSLATHPTIGLPLLLWNDAGWTIPNDQGRATLRTVLNANKETKIGASLMEIIICGALPPYNHLLGGKLVAMLLTSPQIVRDFETRYGQTASTIASKIAGYEVMRPAQIVYLGTSSLYVAENDKTRLRQTNSSTPNPLSSKITTKSKHPSSASQYNRIHIPASIVGRTGEIHYECVGITGGYGSVHYSSDTCATLEELDTLLHQAKRVNSIFGEGTSPRMRKIRQGISILGLDDRFLIHGQSRLVYGIKLAHNTEDYLNGADQSPDYIFPINRPKRTTDAIARYWISRWLSSRLNYTPALEAVSNFTPRDIAISKEYHQTLNL